MKIRAGFVSNSSSSSFVIKNTTNKQLTGKDLVQDLWELNGKKKFSNGKWPGKYKGMFGKRLMERALKDYVFDPKKLIEIEADDEDYENPTSALRNMFYSHSHSARFSFREIKCNQ